MSTGRGARSRLGIAVAALACGAVLTGAPAALAQAPVDPQQAVETVQSAVDKEINGGVTSHPYDCDENNPAVKAEVNGVKDALANLYPDISTMAARGYLPYIDAPLFGMSGRQGHWLNPAYIQDGHVMDPKRPEGILVDRWNRPIGVMFIADDPDVPGPDMYVDQTTGVACNGWHYHGELAADAYWYAYKYLYSGDTLNGDLQPPDRTPDLMHVWAYGASSCDKPGNFKYQFQHEEPPAEFMPGDPQSAGDVRNLVGGARSPVDGPKPDAPMCY